MAVPAHRLVQLAALMLALVAPAVAVRETKYYDALGVATDADEATIKKAYRRQALRYHPDRNPDKADAEQRFREIAAAYEVLSDAEKRRTYDRFGEAGLDGNGGGPGGPGGPGGFHFQHGDPFNIFEHVFGGRGGGGQRVQFEFGGGGGGFGGMGGGMGGGQRFHQQQQQQRGGGESLYKDDALVQELDEDTVPEGDGEHWVWAVEFYAPWCGHCRQLAPKWRQVASALHGVVRVAAVNCEAQQGVCQAQGVQGYPTIKAFKQGKWVEYRGDRSATALRDWALGLLPADSVTGVAKPAQLDGFLKASAASKWGVGMLLLTDKSATSALYKSLALRYKGKLAFGEVRSANKALAAHFNITKYPTLLAVCGGDASATIPFTEEMKNSRLTKFLNGFYGGKRCAEAIALSPNTDFGKMRVSQLKQLLQAKGMSCKDCVEKSDFVKRLKEVFGGNDTLPVLAGFLAIFHVAFLVILSIVTSLTESKDYTCDQKFQVHFALFGTLALYLLSLLNECAVVGVGLRGGPLEEHRRWLIRPLLYNHTVLWVVTFGLTCFSTYLATSPTISNTCWSNNPCESVQSIVPSSCTLDGTEVRLTDACQLITNNPNDFDLCFNEWLDYASTAAVSYYAGTRLDGKPAFRPVEATAYQCNKSIQVDSQQFTDWLMALPNQDSIDLDPEQADENASDRVTLAVEKVFLIWLNITESANSTGQDAPWYAQCQDARCRRMIDAGDNCTDWEALINLPESTSRKTAYQATVYSSWALLLLQVVVVYFAFNAFPAYDEKSAWEGQLQGWGRCFGCKQQLQEVATQEGESATTEIGGLLHLLFGAIDLDPTDEFLGMYLVGERQRARRYRVITSAVKDLGVASEESSSQAMSKSRWQRFKDGIKRKSERFVDWLHYRSDVKLERTMEDAGAPQGESHRKLDALEDGEAGGVEGIEETEAAPKAVPLPAISESTQSSPNLSSLPPSPFDLPVSAFPTAVSAAAAPLPLAARPRSFIPPSVVHSFVRLMTLRPRSSMEVGVSSEVVESSALSDGMKKKLVVEDRSTPLVTPVIIKTPPKGVNISSYEAALRCGLFNAPEVSHAKLEEALRLSNFAQAAYGLQTVRWKTANSLIGCCESSMDCLLSCFSPVNTEAHFRKRNFDAILGITGVDAADLLYVSYTNAAFGALPYLVMLHRPTHSVIVSVRGTVGVNDLITDLLSSPIDASDSLPQWVREEAGPEAPLFAHSGILSSTRAVLRDLEESGLLDSMLARAGSPTEFAAELDRSLESKTSAQAQLETMGAEEDVKLDLRRAQSIVTEAVGNRGWRLVVTGHSLGAAVACMLSFHLRHHFPSLRCFAFCPPGGLMSAPLAAISRQFCTSVVVGCDAISRLTIPNTQRLVDDMVLALARCKRPKLAIVFDILMGRRKNVESTPPTFCAFDDIGQEAEEVLRRYVATSRLHAESAELRNLGLPGRIIHLRPFGPPAKQKAAKGKKSEDLWDAVWTSAEDLAQEGIMLRLDMLKHHRVPTLQSALRSAVAGEVTRLASGSKISADNTV